VLEKTRFFLSATRVPVEFLVPPRGTNGNLCVCFSSAENSRFDAAQYTFFGKAPLEGLELGGLADDGGVDGYGGGFGGHDDGAYHLSPVGEEVRLSLSLSDFVSHKESRIPC
jgi:hypothetical protein